VELYPQVREDLADDGTFPGGVEGVPAELTRGMPTCLREVRAELPHSVCRVFDCAFSLREGQTILRQ
jgi:hypothetical protein